MGHNKMFVVYVMSLMKPALCCCIAFIALASCRKHEADTPDPKPVDPVVSPYPDTTHYRGTIHVTNTLDSFHPPEFDSTYETNLTVSYPDSFLVTLHLEFWDHQNAATSNPYYQLYLAHINKTFLRRADSIYEITSRHYHFKFRLQHDSLIIDRKDGSGSKDFDNRQAFFGKRI